MTEMGDLPSGTCGGVLGIAVELYDLLQRKDSTMGDLLQLMEPRKGVEKAVEDTSDVVRHVASIEMCHACSRNESIVAVLRKSVSQAGS